MTLLLILAGCTGRPPPNSWQALDTNALLDRLFARLDRIAGIDIYLSGVVAGDVKAVRDWAASHNVSPQWVTSRRVTLNYEAGALAKLAPGMPELPFLMRRRGDTVTPLSGSAL